MIIFFTIYQILQLFLIPLLPVYFLYRKFKKKPVVGNLAERLGLVPRPGKTNAPVYWIHAVSVGEIVSTQSLVAMIRKQHPNAICYLTVGTLAGKKIAQEKLSYDYVSFLPYDFLLPILFAFKRIHPKAIIIIEAELWPNLLMMAHWKKIPLFNLNARMSKRSAPRYQKLKKILLPLINLFEKIYTQSDADKTAFEQLGVSPEKIISLGNIKAFNVWEKTHALDKGALVLRASSASVSKDRHACADAPSPTVIPRDSVSASATTDLGTSAAVKANRTASPTLLVGCVHPGELDYYLTLFASLKPQYPTLRLILAPRHFHWKEELINKVVATGFSYVVWEKNETQAEIFDKNTDIILVCKLGELFDLYRHATIYYLGGTFVPVGGHNLLEPAAFGNAIIIGPHNHNCADTAQQLIAHNALLIANNKSELLQQTTMLLQNSEERSRMQKEARAWLENEAARVQKKLEIFIKNVSD